MRRALQLQAEDEEQRRQREKQEYDDERMTARIMLMESGFLTKNSKTTLYTRQTTNYDVTYNIEDNSNEDEKSSRVALRLEKKEKLKSIVLQMHCEYARYERRNI